MAHHCVPRGNTLMHTFASLGSPLRVVWSGVCLNHPSTQARGMLNPRTDPYCIKHNFFLSKCVTVFGNIVQTQMFIYTHIHSHIRTHTHPTLYSTFERLSRHILKLTRSPHALRSQWERHHLLNKHCWKPEINSEKC